MLAWERNGMDNNYGGGDRLLFVVEKKHSPTVGVRHGMEIGMGMEL